MAYYPHLFSSGLIGRMLLPNRIIMPPMATNFADANGGPTQVMFDYYRQRAKGRPGLIIVENANVSYPLGNNGAVQLRIDEERFIPGLAALVETLKAANPEGKVAIQINHAGAQTRTTRTGGHQLVGPADVPTRLGGEIPRPLSIGEIEELVLKFAQAAKRAKRAGFDAVELHGGFAYLLGQFLSPFYNRREDAYGGSTAGRLRFVMEIMREIRREVGRDYPVLFRMNGEEFMPGGLTLAGAKTYATNLEAAQVDLLHVTAGNAYTAYRHIEPMSYPDGDKVFLAEEIKGVVKIPVAAVGVIRQPAMADEIIAAGRADFVAIGRGMIADPLWPLKAATGREDEINGCLSCNVCGDRRTTLDVPVRCTVNPLVGREGNPGRTEALAGKKVLVVGGGPAGLKAALEASTGGAEVTLVEREPALGGTAVVATRPPHKERIDNLTRSLLRDLTRSRVEVWLSTQADARLVAEVRPDLVFVAVGARPRPWPSACGGKIVAAYDLLKKGKIPSGSKVVIVGGGSVGCECAEYLVEAGKEVVILEMLDQVAPDLDMVTRTDFLNRLETLPITIVTGCLVRAIDDGGVEYELCGETHRLPADCCVVAIGFQPDQALYNEIKAANPDLPVTMIGDCRRPGKLFDAIHQAYQAVHDQDW